MDLLVSLPAAVLVGEMPVLDFGELSRATCRSGWVRVEFFRNLLWRDVPGTGRRFQLQPVDREGGIMPW